MRQVGLALPGEKCMKIIVAPNIFYAEKSAIKFAFSINLVFSSLFSFVSKMNRNRRRKEKEEEKNERTIETLNL